MLTGKSQSQLIKAIGAPSNAQSLARALGKGWRGGYVGPENLNILLKSGQPFAAEFKEVGERLAHMVVVDGVNSAGQVLIRDPWGVGTTYRMTMDAFLKAWNGIVVFH